MSPATIRSLSQKWSALRFTTASRCSICAANTAALLASHRAPKSVMAAEWIAPYAVLRPPFVSHVRPNLPQLREEFVAHAFFQNLDRAPFQGFRAKTNRAVNELHMLVAELLK